MAGGPGGIGGDRSFAGVAVRAGFRTRLPAQEHRCMLIWQRLVGR